MSEGYCKTFMLCNVGTDPELKALHGGPMVLNLRVAVNTSYLDKDKVRRERCDWFTCVMYGKRAEALSRAITKGSTLLIEAEPRARSWEDKDGNKRTVVEFHVLDLKFAGGKRGDGPAPEHRAPREGSAPRGGGAAPPPADDYDAPPFNEDDIPFVFIGSAPCRTSHAPRSWL